MAIQPSYAKGAKSFIRANLTAFRRYTWHPKHNNSGERLLYWGSTGEPSPFVGLLGQTRLDELR